MYEVRFTSSYKKKALKFFKKHPDLKSRYKKSIEILRADPFNQALSIRKMSGFKDIYRMRLTINARVVMEILIREKVITPIDIDTRANIYR